MFLLCSNLSQSSEESPNCQEKDEFVFRSGLRKNWRNGNFRVGETTLPMIGKWTLGYSYADFIVWYTSDQKNSWQLCCYDASTDKFIFTFVTYPAQTDMEVWQIAEIRMAKKTLAIIQLDWGYVNAKIWAVDISNPENPTTVWQNQHEVQSWAIEVNNGQVLLSRSPFIPAIEIYDATDGRRITTVEFPTSGISSDSECFNFFPKPANKSTDRVGQQLKMMPIEAFENLQFLNLKDRRASAINPPIKMKWFNNSSFLGPTAFLIGNLNTYKVISWVDDELTTREFMPTGNRGRHSIGAIVPDGDLYAVTFDRLNLSSSLSSISFSRFDHRGGQSEIDIESKNFKASSSQLHFDTLISHSSFTRTRLLQFGSISAAGGFREVQKTVELPAMSYFKIEDLCCLPAMAVAMCCIKRGGANKTVFAVLDFKPE